MPEPPTENLTAETRAFEKSDLRRYTLKQKLLIYTADLVFYFLIRIVCSTLRFEVEGQEILEDCAASDKRPIFTSWHDRIFAWLFFFRKKGIVLMVSQSVDGEYMARCVQRFGYGSVRGSSTRGGMNALVELISLMRAGSPAGITIDGPTGPRYVAKSGACVLAKDTGNPLIPFIVECRRFFQIPSWDRLQIPFPFTKARVIIGKRIFVSEDADENAIREKRDELQHSLDELVKRGVQWRNSNE